jgi:mannose-6-phosphate isomerase-like protein (cupin superfamily)
MMPANDATDSRPEGATSDSEGHELAAQPVVVREDEREWEALRDDEAAGSDAAAYKTLISGGLTRSESLTLGVARIPPGAALSTHRHRQPEVYLMLAGEGSVRVGAGIRPIRVGPAVFVPGDTVHSCENTGASELRLAYVLAADSFDDVEYVFED